MRLCDIALGHIRRKRVRFLLLTATLAFGVAAIVAMFAVTDSMGRQVEERLDRFGANIVMMPRRESLPLVYGGMALGDVGGEAGFFDQDALGAIRTIKNNRNLGVISPKIVGVVEFREARVLMVGALLDEELALKSWWTFVGEFPKAPGEIAVGHDAAAKLKLTVGDALEIKGHPFVVTAVLNPSGGSDDAVLLGGLDEVQRLLGREGQVSLVEIAAFCRGCPVSEMVLQIAEKFPGARVTALSQAVMSKMQSVEMIRSFGYGAVLFVMLTGALLVFMITTASVNERVREIGVFRAMGFRRSHIMEVMLLETFISGIVAALLGTFMGNGLARLLVPMMIPGAGPASVNWAVAVWTLVVTLAVVLTAGFFPSLKASRLDPTDALRTL